MSAYFSCLRTKPSLLPLQVNNRNTSLLNQLFIFYQCSTSGSLKYPLSISLFMMGSCKRAKQKVKIDDNRVNQHSSAVLWLCPSKPACNRLTGAMYHHILSTLTCEEGKLLVMAMLMFTYSARQFELCTTLVD